MSLTDKLFKHKIVAIIRGVTEDKAADVAHALYLGGVRFIAVTMNTPAATGMKSCMSAEEQKQFPHAGALFRLKTDIKGMSTFLYKN